MTALPLQKNGNSLVLKRKIVSRPDGILSGGISSIERWTDDNYAPQLLKYAQEETSQTHRIVASLRGFGVEDVHVDLRHGHVIILLSSDDSAASFRQEEYYCEVLIPAHVKQNKALVEIGDEWLSVTLRKKKLNALTRISS